MSASYHEVLIHKVPIFIVIVNGSAVFFTEDKAAAASIVSSFEELEKKEKYKDFEDLLNYLNEEMQKFWDNFDKTRRKIEARNNQEQGPDGPELY